MALLSIQNATLSLGNSILLDQTDLFIEKNDRICIVGRNGVGKSSLLSVLAGTIPLDSGDRHEEPGLRIGYLKQAVPEHWQGSIFSIVADGLGEEGKFLAAAHLISSGKEALIPTAWNISSEALITHSDVWEHHGEVLGILNSLDLSPDDDFSTLSGGTRRRVALCRAIISSDILLLDEPTNHLDLKTITWLEDYLFRIDKTIVFVSHDRAFVRKLASRITELDRRKLYTYSCNYEEYLRRHEERLHAEEMENNVFEKKLAQEEIWIRQGIKARRTRNMGRVRELLKMREEKANKIASMGTSSIAIQEAEKSGKLVAEMKNTAYTWPDGYQVFRDANIIIQRGDKIGLIGNNGVGKTTFLKVLLGKLQPTSGTVRLGTNLEIAYFDQLRDTLDSNKSVMENIGGGADRILFNGNTIHIAGYLQNFLFDSSRLKTPVGLLSGGERNRLLLAKLFAKPANMLVLDEPTNDLDMETLELLEELLASFNGTVLVVSHDREFLDNLVTSTIALEGDAHVRTYVGGYTDWLRQRSPAPLKKMTARPNQKINLPQKHKLSYNEQRELEILKKELQALPNLLDKLDREQKNLEKMLSDSTLYLNDPQQFEMAVKRLPQIEEEQLALLQRNEDIEMRLSELENI